MMADVMKIDGVSGWMRAAALADVHPIRLSNQLWPEISAQLFCAPPPLIGWITPIDGTL
jgi:mandelate racemase